MTPFVIFAIVLTFGYFIYFAIMITLDLTAKPADGQKNEEEDIDVGDMNDEGVEAPKVINEESDIEGGRMTYTDSVTEDGLRIINQTNSSVPSQDEEKVTSEELNEENEYGMEDIEPEAQHSMYGEELYSFLNEKHKNSRNIKKENVRDHL